MSITCRLNEQNKKKFYTVIIVYLVLIVSTNVQEHLQEACFICKSDSSPGSYLLSCDDFAVISYDLYLTKLFQTL